MFKKFIAALTAVVIGHSPVVAQTTHTSCAAATETYIGLVDADWHNIQDSEAQSLQQLRDFTAVTIDLLGFFNSKDHCLGPEGSALVCATADRLLIEIDHQYNQSMARWPINEPKPKLELQVTDQFKALRARYTRSCIVPSSRGDPA
jgi:hypothetical protein